MSFAIRAVQVSKHRFLLPLSLAASTLLGACGIDQGGGPAPAPESGPQALVLLGPITGFGSITANGASLETAGAQIFVDGNPATETDLKAGQIIRAVATVEAGNADALLIEYQENVRGPVEALDSTAGTLTVLGQSIQTNAQTQFDIAPPGSGLADLAVGAELEISGFRAPTGVINATYVGSAPAGAPLEVTAAISAVDLNGQTFVLGGLTVDYSQASLLQVPNGMPEVGVVVEVEGASLNGVGQLVAEQILALANEPGGFSAADTDAAEPNVAMAAAADNSALTTNFISFITAADLPDTITLGDVQVVIEAGRDEQTLGAAITEIAGGVVNDLQPGQQVQVEGQVESLGTVVAVRITIL